MDISHGQLQFWFNLLIGIWVALISHYFYSCLPYQHFFTTANCPQHTRIAESPISNSVAGELVPPACIADVDISARCQCTWTSFMDFVPFFKDSSSNNYQCPLIVTDYSFPVSDFGSLKHFGILLSFFTDRHCSQLRKLIAKCPKATDDIGMQPITPNVLGFLYFCKESHHFSWFTKTRGAHDRSVGWQRNTGTSELHLSHNYRLKRTDEPIGLRLMQFSDRYVAR